MMHSVLLLFTCLTGSVFGELSMIDIEHSILQTDNN